MHVYENAFDPHTVIILLVLAIDNTLVKHTKRLSLSAPMAIHCSILNYIT